MHRRNVALLLKSPVPYHRPIIRALNQQINVTRVFTGDVRPNSYFRGSTTADSQGPTNLAPRSIRLWTDREDGELRVAFGITKVLNAIDPEAVIVHSWDPQNWSAIQWAKRRSRPVIMWAESTRESGRRRGACSNAFRRLLLHAIDGFVANGTSAKRYLVDLGVDGERISTPGYPVDPRHLPLVQQAIPDKLLQAPESNNRKLKLLFVGRMVGRKRPVDAIDCAECLKFNGVDVSLDIVGEGPELSEVRRRAMCSVVPIRVHGWLEGSDLLAQFAESDVLLVPSAREVWGLVVNEGLDAGLFVVATSDVGSARDLLQSPCVGSTVAVGDTEAMAREVQAAVAVLDWSPLGRAKRRSLAAQGSPGSFDARHFADAVMKQIARIEG